MRHMPNSWRMGEVPEDWRQANVVPIFKKWEKEDPGTVEMEPPAAGTTSGGQKKFTVKTQDEDDNVAPAQLLFKPSCTSSPSPAPKGPAGPEGATYADYIVGQAAISLAPQAKPAAAVTAAVTKPQSSLAMQTNPKDKEPPLNPAPKPGAKHNSIIVSPRQRGNPILKFIHNVPWEFGEIVPDYVLGQSTCALFLSLRYHNLKPNYIHERLQKLGKTYILQVLLVQVDVKDPHQALKELAKICILADCTLVLAWSPEEAGRYLETYKAYEQKPVDLLKEKVDQNYLSRVTDCLTSVKSVNKTDTLSLLSAFGSLASMGEASKEELSLCPGIGPQKAKRLFDVLHEPFLKVPK